MRRKRDEYDEALIERAQKRMLELNQLGHFSDFTFTVQDEQFFVSKIVLSAVSPYFKNQFETEWRFKSSVDLEEEHSVEAFSCMIEYIYTYSYEQSIGQLSFIPSSHLAKVLFEVYYLAEDYEIPGLKEQVLEHLPSAVNGVKSPQGIYCLVSDHYISDSELGEVFVAAVADNVQDMETFEDLDKVKLFLVKTPRFAADLISELIKRRISNCECSN
ncbi:hypothetical protein IFM58399_09297 [Aspergillus lentulus]|uniref:uncharacterized protein n=1 Tax=Aspergillus lentulus TaxID=293939 RepID=UPI0013944BC0|nr:uncharacterized protein IFM58399_09297 [Aspergillus lentulus]GFF52342.1 hypothetical protein IFM58399_09297 [Aspergillus lentulus]GFF79374.1 hypothetical protein IFM62136_10048 [Aspergillus lentulus]